MREEGREKRGKRRRREGENDGRNMEVRVAAPRRWSESLIRVAATNRYSESLLRIAIPSCRSEWLPRVATPSGYSKSLFRVAIPSRYSESIFRVSIPSRFSVTILSRFSESLSESLLRGNYSESLLQHRHRNSLPPSLPGVCVRARNLRARSVCIRAGVCASGHARTSRVTGSMAAGGRLTARQLPSAMSSGVSLLTLSANGLALHARPPARPHTHTHTLKNTPAGGPHARHANTGWWPARPARPPARAPAHAHTH